MIFSPAGFSGRERRTGTAHVNNKRNQDCGGKHDISTPFHGLFTRVIACSAVSFSRISPTFPLDSSTATMGENRPTRGRKRFRGCAGPAGTRIEVKNTLESNGPALYYARKESKYRGTACRNKKQLRQEEGVCDEVCQVRASCSRDPADSCPGDFVHLV